VTATQDAPTQRFSISIATPDDRADISAFVASHPAATAYHQPVFTRVIERACKLRTVTFLARGEDGAVIGILPVALTSSVLFGTYATSLPYFNYGGVLANGAEPTGALIDAAWAWASAGGARHLVLRQTQDRPIAGLPFTTGKETLTLELPKTVDELFKAIGSKTRNLVRKPEKAGLVASTETGAKAVAAFHQVLSENMRDLGSPAQGRRFYEILAEELGDRCEIHVVRTAEGEVAAAGLTIRFRDRVEVPWASCLRRFNGVGANMGLYWHMLKRSVETGAAVFDFGRSTPDSGPYKFKLQWGAKPEPLPWYFVAPDGAVPTKDLSPTNPKYARAIAMWQKLPVSVTRVVGAWIAPRLP
jgi:serine/alanine adding enzyme